MSSSRSAPGFDRGIPVALGDGWKGAQASAVGMDEVRLNSAIEWLDGFRPGNVHGILVVRRGALVFEHYRCGPDQIWDRTVPNAEHGPTTRHDLRSVTKSVLSLLFGIALDRGLVRDPDASVFDHFPEYEDLRTPEKARISLRHLLMMSSGQEWNEYIPYSDPNNSEMAMLRSGDRWRFALQAELVAAPGSIWNYSGGCTELLGAVISRATGKAIDAFAREALFEPLGISDVGWGLYRDQAPSVASGLQMRPRDLAKIGQLVLRRGNWDDKQIVSRQWIDQSTAPQIGPADRLHFYGYQWWLGRSLIDRREIRWILADGLGGQRLFIAPELELVCVITAGLYDEPLGGWLPLQLFNRYVLEAVVQ
jgi:CubicO group peptidase (beta-lactamase class C family)